MFIGTQFPRGQEKPGSQGFQACTAADAPTYAKYIILRTIFSNPVYTYTDCKTTFLIYTWRPYHYCTRELFMWFLYSFHELPAIV